MKAAFRAGIQPAAFWALTPNETRICVEAHVAAEEAARERDLWAAWHGAYMQRCDAKHFPRLEDLLRRPAKPAADTPEAKRALAEDLKAALMRVRPTGRGDPPPPQDQPTQEAADGR